MLRLSNKRNSCWGKQAAHDEVGWRVTKDEDELARNGLDEFHVK